MARDGSGGALRRDARGQMMILSAIVLLVGFIALAGLVSRVNQLAAQTATESRQAILDQVAPLAEAIDSGIAELNGTSFLGNTTAGRTYVTTPANAFTAGDVGRRLRGEGIPAEARIVAVNSPRNVTLGVAATATGQSTLTLGFGLSGTSTPLTLQEGVAAHLEQLQRVMARHGLALDWRIACSAPTQGQVLAHLSDGHVWLEVGSARRFSCSGPQSG